MLELGIQVGLVVVGILGILVAMVLLGWLGESFFSPHRRSLYAVSVSIFSIVGLLGVFISWLVFGWWSFVWIPLAFGFGVLARKMG